MKWADLIHLFQSSVERRDLAVWTAPSQNRCTGTLFRTGTPGFWAVRMDWDTPPSIDDMGAALASDDDIVARAEKLLDAHDLVVWVATCHGEVLSVLPHDLVSDQAKTLAPFGCPVQFRSSWN